jgi:hypothetical protein
MALTILMRFLHIASISTLVGGCVFAGLVSRGFSNEVAARWRPIVTAAVVICFLSGLYTLLHKAVTPDGYHMYFGIKILLALHVMAVSVRAGRSSVSEEKRARLLRGAAFTGLAIVAISARLRWM